MEMCSDNSAAMIVKNFHHTEKVGKRPNRFCFGRFDKSLMKWRCGALKVTLRERFIGHVEMSSKKNCFNEGRKCEPDRAEVIDHDSSHNMFHSPGCSQPHDHQGDTPPTPILRGHGYRTTASSSPTGCLTLNCCKPPLLPMTHLETVRLLEAPHSYRVLPEPLN